MVNIEDFVNRFQQIMDYYGESASSFAEKIGVQRSSISHILSGRNKPSLDFILKTLSAFPEVDLYWLLNGKGEFPKDRPAPITRETDLFSVSESIKEQIKTPKKSNNDKEIERIVIFYTDGSFKNFQNLE
ncbi:helix-turn-helix domain-containing protein [Flavivirga algicola]|uniref:Helix-turn-helix transcriptional regulator n=1 Tax=Flavivirga algicola TaxID=2729136 RepID=A0ABX1RXA0_9FLAO|nr:helix-turn-helix transcriptional regulator [Flavivirga algicola]NMH88201.1 helix-turn-helix transcriptional regulator [Flavivirga algicola]